MAPKVKNILAKGGQPEYKVFSEQGHLWARKNKIRELTDSIWVVHSDFAAMGKLTTDYFCNLFSANTSLDATPVIDLVQPLVAEEDNIKLRALFTDQEISDALFQIGP